MLNLIGGDISIPEWKAVEGTPDVHSSVYLAKLLPEVGIRCVAEGCTRLSHSASSVMGTFLLD